MQGRFPQEIQYEEHTLTLLANGKPFPIGGTVRFVQVLSTTDATDSQEFSVNDGATWTRLRKGICPRFPESTTGLKLRNNTGADVDVIIATGMASFDDRRLVIDPLAGTIPVAEQHNPAIFTAPLQFLALVGVNNAAANVEKQILAIAAGPLKIAHASVAQLTASGNGDLSYIYARNAGGQKLLLASTRGDNSRAQMIGPIQLPANFGLFMVSDSAANSSWYEVGCSRED